MTPMAERAWRALTRRRVVTAALVYAGLAVLFHLHGFSWGRWAVALQEPSLDTALLGRARGVRADDFSVTLPTIFSQINSTPAFSTSARTFGLGEVGGRGTDLRLSPCPVPTRHWTAIFKPQLWGYFLSADFGMGWHWNFYAVGLFLTTFFVLLRLNGGESASAAILALAFVFSPFVQFWSYLPGHFYLFGWLIFLSFENVLVHTSWPRRIASTTLLIWSALAFAFWIYPPFQLPVAGAVGALCIGVLVRELRKTHARKFRALAPRVLLFATAAGTVATVLFFFLEETRETVRAITQTVYPGQRSSAGGGGLSPQLWLGNFIFPPLLRAVPNLAPNLCEGAGFVCAFPMALLAWASGVLRNERLKPILAAVGIFTAALMYWEWFGIPQSWATHFGLGRLVAGRNMIGYGVIELVSVGALVQGQRGGSKERVGSVALLAIWAVLYAFVYLRIRSNIPAQTWPSVCLFAIASFGVTASLLKFPRAFVVGYCALAVLSTGLFNPVVRGGYRHLVQNSELLKAVSDIAREDHFESAWVSLADDAWSDLIRSLGIRTLDGIFFYPQYDLWKPLDASGKFQDVYNRYAEVSYRGRHDGMALSLTNPAPNSILVRVDLEQRPFLDMPLRYLICSESNAPSGSSQNYRLRKRIPGPLKLSIWEKVTAPKG